MRFALCVFVRCLFLGVFLDDFVLISKRDTFVDELIRFGGDLLSHVLRRSTIGAVALNCRVRDGIGCFAYAMTTKPSKTSMLLLLPLAKEQQAGESVSEGCAFPPPHRSG